MENPFLRRVVGGTPEQKEAVMRKIETMSEDPLKAFHLEDAVVEPTAEEATAISRALDYANEVAAQYGATNRVEVNHVFVVEPGSIKTVSKSQHAYAFCNPTTGSIIVERIDPAALLSHWVVHEVFHMDAHTAMQITTSDKPALYRAGISTTNRKADAQYFWNAQEAIIATLTQKFFDTVIASDPQYAEQLYYTEQIKNWLYDGMSEHLGHPKDHKYLDNIEDILLLPDSKNLYEKISDPNASSESKIDAIESLYDGSDILRRFRHERAEELKQFNKVMAEIVDASHGETNHDALFDEFARAHFTGNYMPLARLIEGIMGKGSFRKIAEELSDMKDIEPQPEDEAAPEE